MDVLDLYYRALDPFRKITEGSAEAKRFIKLWAGADEKIEIVKRDCKIDTDWIEEIEKGLVFIGKAISEERQFIRSDGEVLPIEKVKSVSKDSVGHLAKHGNLLTRTAENGDISPEKLYTVEKLSDYAVYENRFLYMLLCRLRDFIALRYDKICELSNTYNGVLHIRKTVNSDDRKAEYEVKLNEEIRNDARAAALNAEKDKIDRINLIYKTALAYLSTPLMENVAKSPVLKPPVTETNVLKMNRNFKGAKELYYFITAYKKDGYAVTVTKREISPFSEEISSEFASVASIYSYLTYKHGLGLEKVLKDGYEEYLEREKAEAAKAELEKLESLRGKIKKSGAAAEEYMLALENRARGLEREAAVLKGGLERLNTKAEEAEADKARIKANAEEAERKYADAEAKVKARESEIESLDARRAAEIENLKEEFALGEMRLKEEFAAEKAVLEARISESGLEAEKLKNECERLTEENRVLSARLNAEAYLKGTLTQEFTDEESFNELERQYKAFKAVFNENWKAAKKKIRREQLKGGKK